MRTADSGIQGFECHVYDLEIQTLRNKIISHFYTIPKRNFKEGITPDVATNFVNSFYDHYYEKIGIQEPWGCLVVEAGDVDYKIFLAMTIAILDPFKLKSFLSYHKAKFLSRESFDDVIEFQVYDLIDSIIPIKNDNRKERVMNWVYESKKEIKNKVQRPIQTIKPIWNKDYYSVLKKLSKRLSKAKFTQKQTDFEKVFSESKPTNWLKEVEFLCYLLFKLREKGMFKSSKGKGHYKIIAEYFNEDSGKLGKKNFISDTIYNITERNPQNYDHIRKEIDLMLAQVFRIND